VLFRSVGWHANSPSPYVTFDQGGNVSEWLETTVDFSALGEGVETGLAGGSYWLPASFMSAQDNPGMNRDNEYSSFGFRIVEVPEPMTLSLLGLGALGLIRRRR
jgi:formylglycine-generating enzyme